MTRSMRGGHKDAAMQARIPSSAVIGHSVNGLHCSRHNASWLRFWCFVDNMHNCSEKESNGMHCFLLSFFCVFFFLVLWGLLLISFEFFIRSMLVAAENLLLFCFEFVFNFVGSLCFPSSLRCLSFLLV